MSALLHTIFVQNDPDLLSLEQVWQDALAFRILAGAFARALEAIRWDAKPVGAFQAGIEMCLALDAVDLARELAARGAVLHPTDDMLATLSRVLAPPIVLSVGNNTQPDQSLSVQWLQDHSRAYAGSWVALRNGALLGSADTRQMLIERLGIPAASPELLITWLP